MPIPEWRFKFTAPPARYRVGIPAMLREFHRAMLLGMEIEHLSIDGRELTPHQLLLLNAWVASRGAWNASRQDYFEAWRRLQVILDSPYLSPSARARRRVR